MRLKLLHSAFSYSLLIIYSMVIFQQGVIEGIHFLSHATEIVSNNYSFHSHGNGHFHFHHHGFMETVKSILEQNNAQDHNQDQVPFQQQQIKLHLPGYFFSEFKLLPEEYKIQMKITRKLFSVSLEVLTPPPKSLV